MCSLENVVEVGRVRFGLDRGRDSCIHAGKCITMTKAGVNAENVFHTLKTYGKVGESRDLRLSSLSLLCCLLLGTATLLGVSRHCRLLCTSDGVVLVLAWASDVVLLHCRLVVTSHAVVVLRRRLASMSE